MLGDDLSRTCLLRAPDQVDIAFVDPPYALMHDEQSRTRVIDQVGQIREIMGDEGVVVLRSPIDAEALGPISGFDETDARRYRPDMWVLFYEPKPRTP